MKKTLFILLIAVHIQASLPFKKVVLWGHKLHSHTHSYIHWGFKRAFEHLGYETYWLDNNDNLSNLNLENALFITETQADQRIPMRDDAFYILHNCDGQKYKKALNEGRAIIMQVYTHDVPPRNVTKHAPFIYYNIAEQILYMPWATDLLPHEIDHIKRILPNVRQSRTIPFIGSTGGGEFGNYPEISEFSRACKQYGIQFQNLRKVSVEDSIKATRESFMAPAIQGAWQCKQGYIPCRIFKNISYGQIGVTNSSTVHELFNKKIVYNSNTYQLFYDAIEYKKNYTMQKQYELMDFVRDNHTYLNRIEVLLKLLNAVYENKQMETAHEKI